MTADLSDLLISVVIPVKNGSAWLDDTIPAILNQKISGQFEILVIDSGSTDNTLSIVKKYPIRLIQIDPEDFNHGLTRNLGVRESKGKYIVMTVQDAKPLTSGWLQELLNGFSDDAVAGVCGQQIVPHHRDKNPVEWFRPISKPNVRRYQFRQKENLLNLKPEEQLAFCRWDDVNAMYRTEVLTQLPFRKTDFAEDALWARDALMAGYAIVYNPLAQVEHYHQADYEFAFKRNFIIQYHFNKYFNTIPRVGGNGLMENLRVLKLLLRESKIPFAEKWKWFRYNYTYRRAVTQSNRLFLENFQSSLGDSLEKKYMELSHNIPQARIIKNG